MHRFKCGDQVCFSDYSELLEGMEPVFHKGDLLVVAAVDGDGVLTCFPIDHWGRVISMKGDTIFPEEVLPLAYAPRVPRKRLPRPFGEMDNEIENLPVGIDFCRPSDHRECSRPVYTNAVYKPRFTGGHK